MRSNVIEVTTPAFDDDAAFDSVAKPLDRQAFVAELSIEAFIGAVLPWFARIDQRSFDVLVGEPFENRVADKLRTVVRTQMARCAVRREQARKHFDHTVRTDASDPSPARLLESFLKWHSIS